jgi:hypothetical protein
VVRVWTISAEAGVGGRKIADALAASLGIPMLDRAALLELSGEGGSVEDVDSRLHGRLQTLGLQYAAVFGATEALDELTALERLSQRGRDVLKQLGHERCVIYAHSVAGALEDHESALHLRLWAPVEWRIEHYAHDHVVSVEDARDRVHQLDRLQRDLATHLFDLDVDDLRRFTLAMNASRVSGDHIVAAVLGAGGAAPAG